MNYIIKEQVKSNTLFSSVNSCRNSNISKLYNFTKSNKHELLTPINTSRLSIDDVASSSLKSSRLPTPLSIDDVVSSPLKSSKISDSVISSDDVVSSPLKSSKISDIIKHRTIHESDDSDEIFVLTNNSRLSCPIKNTGSDIKIDEDKKTVFDVRTLKIKLIM